MKRFAIGAVLSTFVSIQVQASPSAVVDVVLNPAGDFKAKTTEVVGEAYKDGDSIRAEVIKVKLGNLKTGMPLRDKHAKDKYLEVSKFPEAVLTNAVGKNGVGKAKLKIRGVEKEVTGKYKVEGKFLKADFPIQLSDYGISGISYMGVGVEDKVNINVVVPLREGGGKAPASVGGSAGGAPGSSKKRSRGN